MNARPRNYCLPGLDAERDLSKSQWYTPPKLAERMWSWWVTHQTAARPDMRWHVLEPSAGNGSLVRAVLASDVVARVHAFELDPRNVELLKQLVPKPGCVLDVEQGDFLLAPVVGRYHVALMNPPYEDGQDVDFVLRALAWAPVVVGVFRSAIVHGDDRYQRLWRWVDPTRGRWLSDRPAFGTGDKSDSARSDFIVLELVMRERARTDKELEEFSVLMGWW